MVAIVKMPQLVGEHESNLVVGRDFIEEPLENHHRAPRHGHRVDDISVGDNDPVVEPPVVRGESDAPRGAFRRMDFESLAVQLVEEGLAKADDDANDLHGRVVDRVEREVIAQVLGRCDGVQIKAAQRLGINRNTLHKKIKDYGLDGGENGSAAKTAS